jgi:hypothetical protein
LHKKQLGAGFCEPLQISKRAFKLMTLQCYENHIKLFIRQLRNNCSGHELFALPRIVGERDTTCLDYGIAHALTTNKSYMVPAKL